ncbi:hypothetical protein [Sphingobium abikonense]|uniref:hypothetical protein n=1 Tax=Sphingobium abikonense TaxID=86193 RepID=UPI0035178246
MAIFYSAATPGFFDDAIHADLPADAVAITAAHHRELLAAQAEGASIVADDRGKPRAHRPTVTIATRRAALIRAVKRQAARRIDAIAPIWRQLNDQRAPSEEGEARFAAIDAIRAASDAIEADIAAAAGDALATIDPAAHPLWPQD